MANDLAQYMQTTMEEMVCSGYHDDWEILRLCPGENIIERNGFIRGTMDHDRVPGYRFCIVVACAFYEASCGANQYQSLCRVSGFNHAFGDAGLHKSTERKAS